MKPFDEMTYAELVFAREGYWGALTPAEREECTTHIAMRRLARSAEDVIPKMPKIWNGERGHMNGTRPTGDDRTIALRSDPTFLRYIAVHWNLTEEQRIALIEWADEIDIERGMQVLASST